MQNQNTDDLQGRMERLKAEMTDLNNMIVQLAKSQENLGKTLKTSGSLVDDFGDAAGDAAKKLQKLNDQLSDNAKDINTSTKSLQQNKSAVADLEKEYQDLMKTQGPPTWLQFVN